MGNMGSLKKLSDYLKSPLRRAYPQTFHNSCKEIIHSRLRPRHLRHINTGMCTAIILPVNTAWIGTNTA